MTHVFGVERQNVWWTVNRKRHGRNDRDVMEVPHRHVWIDWGNPWKIYQDMRRPVRNSKRTPSEYIRSNVSFPFPLSQTVLRFEYLHITVFWEVTLCIKWLFYPENWAAGVFETSVNCIQNYITFLNRESGLHCLYISKATWWMNRDSVLGKNKTIFSETSRQTLQSTQPPV